MSTAAHPLETRRFLLEGPTLAENLGHFLFGHADLELRLYAFDIGTAARGKHAAEQGGGYGQSLHFMSSNVVPDHAWEAVRSTAFQGMCPGILLGVLCDPYSACPSVSHHSRALIAR